MQVLKKERVVRTSLFSPSFVYPHFSKRREMDKMLNRKGGTVQVHKHRYQDGEISVLSICVFICMFNQITHLISLKNWHIGSTYQKKLFVLSVMMSHTRAHTHLHMNIYTEIHYSATLTYTSVQY